MPNKPVNPTSNDTISWKLWFWNAAKNVAAVVGFIVIIVTVLLGAGQYFYPDFDPLGLKEGELRAMPPLEDDSRAPLSLSITLVNYEDEENKAKTVHDPWGPNLATPVYYENIRSRSCLIRRVEFTWKKLFRTPERETKAGKMETIVVNLHRTIIPGARIYRKTLNPAIEVGGQHWVCLEVAVIDAKRVGWSCDGVLKVVYNDNKVIEVPDVTVDFLAKDPPPLNSLDER